MSKVAKPLSLVELKNELTSSLRRTALRPTIFGYKPQPIQEAFHKSQARGKLAIGGNRSGKSVTGGAEMVMRLTGKHEWNKKFRPPVRGRAVGVDFDNGVNKIIMPEIARWMPTSELINGSWEESYSRGDRTLTLANGSTCEFMCVDLETEILTRRGWKNRYELIEGDDMLAVNPKTGLTEWKHIETIYTNTTYKGKMVKLSPFSSQGIKMTIDALVTPNHKWLTQRGLIKTYNMVKADQIQIVRDCNENPDSPYTDSYVQICGWVGGDGTIVNDGARIHQAHVNTDKKRIIEKILANSTYEWSTYDNNVYSMYKVYGSFEKKLDVSILSKTQRELYLEALLLSDGTIESTGKWQFTNTDKELIDIVMMLGTLCGYRISCSERRKSEWGKKDVFCVMGRAIHGYGRNPNVLKCENMKNTLVDFEGTVWCPGSEFGTFIARRGGTVYITGNSYDQDVDKFAGTSRHCVWLDEEPPEEIFNECLTRLVDVGGDWWMTMTPLIDMSWTLDRIYNPGMTGTNPNIEVFEMPTSDNIYVNSAEIDILTIGMTDEQKDARLKGHYMTYSGTIYADVISQETYIDSIVDSDTWSIFYEKWGHFGMLDHGYRAPTAFLLGAFDEEGRIVIYDEYYEAGRLVGENALEIKSLIAKHKLTSKMQYIVADPSVKNTDPIAGGSVQSAYAEFGVYFSLANNNVVAGINRVSSRFKTKQLLITRNCTNLIKELGRYRWDKFQNAKVSNRNNVKETPLKKDDHACDALRYGVASRPALIGEIEMKVGNLLNAPVALERGEMKDYELISKWGGNNLKVNSPYHPILGDDW